jgi:hypothetical protein
MIDTTKIFEAISQRGLAVASSESAKIATLTLRSNAAYENVLGFNFGIKTTKKLTVGDVTTYVEDSAEYVGGARVSITDANGKIILPMIPYELIKHAKEAKFVDRFIEISDVRAYDADIYVRFEFPPTPKVDNEEVRFMVDATALYSKRVKTL